MKKFAIFVAFIVAIFFSSNVSATNWELVNSVGDVSVYVDKDSIKQGTKSEQFPKFNREDGFSAKVKMEIKMDGYENVEITNLMSFYKENGERYLRTLDSYDEKKYPENDSQVTQEKIDVKGKETYKIWDYIEANLK